MKGIVDTQAISMYKEDLKKSIDEAIDPESPKLNIYFLENRNRILKQEIEKLGIKRDSIKEELEKVISKLGGELFTINQLLKYTIKEEGACEIKIQELKESIKEGQVPNEE